MNEMAQALSLAMTHSMAQTFHPMFESITRLAAHQSQPGASMVDTRGMGRPPPFSGDEASFREWRGKVTAYLCATNDTAKTALQCAELQETPITDETMTERCTEDDLVDEGKLATGQAFNTKLYLVLIDICRGEPFRLVEAASGSGLEAWRQLMRRYASRTPGTKRALMLNVFSMQPASSPAAFESLLLTFEENCRRIDSMAPNAISDDVKCAVVVQFSPKDLKDHLELCPEDFVYADLRKRAMTWIERKREQHPKNLAQMEQRNTSGVTPMDTSWVGEDLTGVGWSGSWDEWDVHGVQDWGGHPGPSMYAPTWPDAYATTEDLQYMYKGKGGKGFKGKGKGGKGSMGKGGKGSVSKGGKGHKGGFKGDGKGKGSFNGECHWCGAWGHPARLCRQKDAYMENVRRSQGQTSSIEQHTPQVLPPTEPSKVDGLEFAGTYRDMNKFELGSILVQNRYAALASSEEEDHFAPDPTKYPPLDLSRSPRSPETRQVARDRVVSHSSKCPHRCATSNPDRPKTDHFMKHVRSVRPMGTTREVELSSAEVVRKVVLTIDSGAAEHVVGPRDLPHVRTVPSSSNATYTMANGAQTVGRGEQQVSATTAAGQVCNFRAQVTDVRRPLMSVSRICDGGNTVFFNSSGGYIESAQTGERIHFQREHNVYRLPVEVSGGDFPRPGR